MSKRRSAIHGLVLAGLLAAPWPAHTADVKVQPAAGSGLVVTDATGTQERLRVQESGPVFLPGLAPLPSLSAPAVCADAVTGLVGTCTRAKQIVCAKATTSKLCNSASPCPQDFLLEAQCPLGFTRLTLVGCTRPLSTNLRAETFIDPYFSKQDTIACHYTGSIDSFTTENLEIMILCIEQTCLA